MPMYFTGEGLKSGKEQTGTEWDVKFECSNGHTYTQSFKDGRKTGTLFEGKEVWGQERSWGEDTFKLEYSWDTKEEFERRVQNSILRRKECIESDTKSIKYLESLV